MLTVARPLQSISAQAEYQYKGEWPTEEADHLPVR